MHPKERPAYDRRQFLRNSLYVGLGAVAGPGLLSACGSESSPGGQGGQGVQLPLARPDNPVKLPIPAGMKPIADGMKPETGTLKIFNYADYLAPGVQKAFEKEYGVEVEVTTFNSMDEAVAKLRTGQTDFDVIFPTSDVISRVALGSLIQPLNHSYLPNLTNVWPQLQDPYYDQDARYTVPYTVYSTGIGYRADKVSTIPANGYDIFWDPQYSGQTHILDDGREAIAMSLLRNGETDVNTEDPAKIEAAAAELRKLVPLVRVKVDINGYSELPEGRATVHQCWSGDLIGAQYYLPKGETPKVLGYWRAEGSNGMVGNDTMAVAAGAPHPVLAHHFLNFMLNEDTSLRNFGWVGYQPAIAKFTPSYLTDQGYVPANLANTVLTVDEYNTGRQLGALSPEGRALWDDAWAKFKSG